MTAKPCITPGCTLLATRGPRCPTHQKQHDHHRNARRTHYQGNWTATSLAARRAHVAEHGLICIPPNAPPHPVATIGHLQLDHTTGLCLCSLHNVHAGPAPH